MKPRARKVVVAASLVGLAALPGACNGGRRPEDDSARDRHVTGTAFWKTSGDVASATSGTQPAHPGSPPPSVDAGRPSLPVDAGGPPELRVPRTAAAINPTGHFDVKIWGQAAKVPTLFDDHGEGLVPMSEVRFLWGKGNLYVFFYGGDFDIQAYAKKHDGPVWKDDSVAFTFFTPGGDKLIIQASPAEALADGRCPGDASGLDDPRCDLKWESGARVGADADRNLQ